MLHIPPAISLETAHLHARIVHDGLQVGLGKQLVKSAVVERTVVADHTSKQDTFYSLLLNQELVESEESHDVAHENLFRSITLVLKNYALEQFE